MIKKGINNMYKRGSGFTIKKILLALTFIGILVIGFIFAQQYLLGADKKTSENGFTYGMEFNEQEYINLLKYAPSDIEGKSKFDKYKMGLEVEDRSDTDKDGLSDKDEIEKFKTDPLRASTAGDLYTDGYKVANNLNPLIYYEYEEDLVFLFNECEEVFLEAVQPQDFCAVVKEITGNVEIKGRNVYKAYQVNNYSGEFTVDVSDIIDAEKVEDSDLEVIVLDGTEMKTCRFEVDGTKITLNRKFNYLHQYEIYFVQDEGFWGTVNYLIANLHESTSGHKKEDNICYGLVYGFPLLELVGRPLKIKYEDLFNKEKNNYLKDEMISYAEKIYGQTYEGNSMDRVKRVSETEIKSQYNKLKEIAPFFENKGRRGFQHIVFTFTLYEGDIGGKETVDLKNENKLVGSETGFDKYRDEFPFSNFGTEISPHGICAGMNYYTMYLFNKKEFPSTGSTVFNDEKIGEIKWDLTTDKENATLLDPGLSDFKSKSFETEHLEIRKVKGQEVQIVSKDLTDGEKEAIKMLECQWEEVNRRIDLNKYVKKEGQHYSYDLIEKVKDYLDQGKILMANMMFVSGAAHSVNIYDYFYDKNDENIIWFKIYDTNLPHDEGEKYKVQNGTSLMKITKRKTTVDGEYEFALDYFPIKEVGSYRVTSELYMVPKEYKKYNGLLWEKVNSRYMMVIFDEDWNILN